jgi:hypothetical protein
MSAFGGKADIAVGQRKCPKRTSPPKFAAIQPDRVAAQAYEEMRALLIVWSLAVSAILTPAVAAPLPRTVLILDESDPSSGAPTTFSAMWATLSKFRPSIAVFGETLDLSRFAGPTQEAILSTYVQQKYSDVRFGVIVAVPEQKSHFCA